jgi:hypothetical protein
MTPREADRLQLLLRYLIQRADDEETALTITKLVKLLYLFDVEYYRVTGHQLTGLDWRFYFYGPYDAAIESALSMVGLEVEERPGKAAQGRSFRGFHSRDADTVDLESSFDWLARSVIDEQWKAWADADLNQVLSHVYFETEPMLAAKPMGALDFTTIKPRPRVRPLSAEATLSSSAVTQLRANLERVRRQLNEQRLYGEQHNPPLAASRASAYSDVVASLEGEAGRLPVGLRGEGPTWHEFHSERELP